MKQPIPDAALDDRLGFVGTAGSGKSYNAMGRVERLLAKHARVCCVDPLGVFWGLRLREDGKTESDFNIPIFGGPHGDLPLTEHSGALIGETVAGMAESCIVDLSEIGTKNGERRFMLHFLTALYRKSKDEPLHLVIDEADMFAPQKLTDKEGEAAKLLGMMETVVRRGRIKGFIPWLITQRPAVIAKDVLSQVDGLVAFKLTSSQDRDALSAWVEGSAEKEDWKTMRAALPAMERGQGVVWIPGRGIMETVSFPEKTTFDSSRTPKRGEKKSTASLRPLDLSKLKERLAVVDAETKANDPKALKAEIAKLNAELRKKPADTNQRASDLSLAASAAMGYERGFRDGHAASATKIMAGLDSAANQVRKTVDGLKHDLSLELRIVVPRDIRSGSPKAENAPTRREPAERRPVSKPSPAASGDGTLTNPQRTLLRSLAWWREMGHAEPSRAQVAAIAGWKPSGSNLKDRLSEMSKAGFVSYPRTGIVALSADGAAAAPAPDMSVTLIDSIRGILTGPQLRLFNALLDAGTEIARAELAGIVGWEPNSSNLKDRLSELSRLEVVEYPQRGSVMLQGWVIS